MAIAALIVHYFNSLPLAQLMGNQDPLAPECVAAQRTAILDFITHALFREPDRNSKSAKD
jgi:hypothetical protein